MKYLLPLRSVSAFLILLLWQMCTPKTENQSENPPMEGFNVSGSDAKAIRIADEVMAAQGGRKNWDATHFISWNFLGFRKLTWDKYTGDVRIDYTKEDKKIIVNVNSGQGKVFMKGAEVTQPDSLAKYLKEGKEAWINDSYWLVMPFKLKDSGVTLKYLGEDTTQTGQQADVLQLTFQDVGVTPDNKYKVYVDKNSRLVSQWAYFKDARDDKPEFEMPWLNYKTYGNIKLSGDRGKAKLTDIQVADEINKAVFTSFQEVK